MVSDEELLLAICRCLNNRGGFVYLGINSGTYFVTGIPIFKKDKKELTSYIANSLKGI
jgi:hypothetical protein